MKDVSVPYQIPFHDVDSLNIVWHGHYYKYFELARTELFRACSFDVSEMQQSGYAFPVIESYCRYSEPLRYGQRVVIKANFKQWKSYVLIAYAILDAGSGKRLAYGHTKQAVCNQKGQLLMAVPESVTNVITA